MGIIIVTGLIFDMLFVGGLYNQALLDVQELNACTVIYRNNSHGWDRLSGSKCCIPVFICISHTQMHCLTNRPRYMDMGVGSSIDSSVAIVLLIDCSLFFTISKGHKFESSSSHVKGVYDLGRDGHFPSPVVFLSKWLVTTQSKYGRKCEDDRYSILFEEQCRNDGMAESMASFGKNRLLSPFVRLTNALCYQCTNCGKTHSFLVTGNFLTSLNR